MPVQVRDASERDAGALARLWSDLVTGPTTEPVVGDPPEVVVAKAVVRFTDDDSGRIIVAEVDGTIVGCGFMSVGIASPFDEGLAVHLSHVQVSHGFARQGVGTAMVESTLTWAESLGIESVVTSVPASHREANRFLARLGMAPVASLRGGSVAALRARLPHGQAAAVRKGARKGRSVGQVVAARRSQRRARTRSQAAAVLPDPTVGAAD